MIVVQLMHGFPARREHSAYHDPFMVVMARFIPISEAKPRLVEIVRDSDDDDVWLLRHARPAAVVVSARRWDALHEEIEDLRDRLSIVERNGVTVDFDKIVAELALKLD